MKVVSTKENFLKAISLAGQIIKPRPNLPILGNFLLQAKNGVLEITATDLETTLNIRVPVKTEMSGETTAPGRILVDLCQAAEAERVLLSTEKDRLLVKLGTTNASLPTIGASEFPHPGKFESGDSLEIEKNQWLEFFSEVAFCTAPEGGRPVLSGVLLQADKGSLNLVATDGYRLAKKEVKIKGTIKAIIPGRTLQEAAKAIAAQEDEMLEIGTDVGKNQLRFKTRDLTITSRLLEGDYPNYDQIMPNSFVTQISTRTKELTDAVKLAALFAREVGNVVRLESEDKAVKVCASTAQVGEAETSIAASIEGDKIKIAFNSRFFLESLAAIKANEVSLSLSGPTSAALIRGIGDQSLVYLIMPVRIQG